jgi:hypothetical protein
MWLRAGQVVRYALDCGIVVRFPVGARNFSMGPTQPPIQQVAGASPKRAERI